MIFRRHKRIFHNTIDPDQVLLDSQNRPNFNIQQFEGVIEQSIGRRSVYIVGILITLVLMFFIGQLVKVQIVQGEKFFSLSERNRLNQIPIFSERGVIFDRNHKALAWNISGPEGEPFFYRQYINNGGFGHLLGYVGYPTRDKSGVFWRENVIGKSGIEKKYNKELSGKNGSKIVEVDAEQKIITENMTIPSEPGNNIILTIDSDIQSELFNAIKQHAEENHFDGGAGIIMNIKNGEVLAMTSYPEFDSNVLSQGKDVAIIGEYAVNPKKVYLNRAISGLYTPGSIMKPYLAIGALQENIINPNTTIFSSGQIEIPNRYNPEQPQIFRDWKKGGHGPTNIYTAIAESVNTYFYAIGGGYNGQAGLGISKIELYVKKFGIGTSTGFFLENDKNGTIPSPEWKLKTFKSDNAWRLGDTYNSSIGQFGFQVSLLQMIRAVGALANGGELITPHIDKNTNILSSDRKLITGIDEKNYAIIRDAMRQTVIRGTAKLLDLPYVSVAAKTGTAKKKKKNRSMNSWITGFFPTNDPTYAFVIMMDTAPSTNEAGASRVMRNIFDNIYNRDPEFFNIK